MPKGYFRESYSKDSYSGWIQNLPLKKTKDILQFNNTKLYSNFYSIFAVIDLPLLFNTDIEQCADFSMRMWAEYHKALDLLDKLYLFQYDGTKIYYSKSGKGFKDFLRQAFGFSNSYSLKAGCKTLKASSALLPGDMFVQNKNGGIGHVSVIVDVCKNQDNEFLYLVGYSFMPAQEFHIEYAKDEDGKAGWFTYEGYIRYLNQTLPYGEPVLRRFE